MSRASNGRQKEVIGDVSSKNNTLVRDIQDDRNKIARIVTALNSDRPEDWNPQDNGIRKADLHKEIRKLKGSLTAKQKEPWKKGLPFKLGDAKAESDKTVMVYPQKRPRHKDGEIESAREASRLDVQ